MEESIWEERVRKNASAKGLGPRNWVEEREEVQVFVEDQLRKGYIWPSKLPQILLVYFVAKKDRTQRMVQDYCHINR